MAKHQPVRLHRKSTFSENVTCDLDLRTHDLENVITVTWIW